MGLEEVRLTWGMPVPQKLPSPARVGHLVPEASMPKPVRTLSSMALWTSLMGTALKMVAPLAPGLSML